MEKKTPKFPYRQLGSQLKSLRKRRNETVNDVSGAVEVEADFLSKVEAGTKLPGEDILLLLISHFDLAGEEAMQLWKLAGYDTFTDSAFDKKDLTQQPAVFILPIDSRVVYSDETQITANGNGVVLNFKQTNQASNNQNLSIAKIGMSRDHAERFLKTLQNVLSQSINLKDKDNDN